MGLPIIYRQRCTSPTATHADYPDLRPSPTPPPRQEAAQNGGTVTVRSQSDLVVTFRDKLVVTGAAYESRWRTDPDGCRQKSPAGFLGAGASDVPPDSRQERMFSRTKATAARPSAREPSLALIVSLGLVLGPDVLVARARIFKVNK